MYRNQAKTQATVNQADLKEPSVQENDCESRSTSTNNAPRRFSRKSNNNANDYAKRLFESSGFGRQSRTPNSESLMAQKRYGTPLINNGWVSTKNINYSSEKNGVRNVESFRSTAQPN